MSFKLGGFLVVLCIFATEASIFLKVSSNTADRTCYEIDQSARQNPYNSLYDNSQIEKVYFELSKPCKTTKYAISKTNMLRASPDFDVKLNTVVIVTGGRTHTDEPYTQGLLNAYHCVGDVNVIVVNAFDTLHPLYYIAAYQTEELGQFVATGLRNLNITGKDIHLIGHGLGAHLMGSAGRHFASETGEKIARITGLDPARPCFKQPIVFARLSVEDATFVDIIHSNPGDIGTEEAIGHADFYPNGLESIQPLCRWDDMFCAHVMSMDYYTESVYKGKEKNFMGSHCDAFSNLSKGTCSGTKAPMGYAANEKSKGIYFLEVNSYVPFDTNSKDNEDQDLKTCGVCTN